MASSKKRRKRLTVDRRLQGGKPAASGDGDRRRRAFGSLVRQTLRHKQKIRDWTLDDGPPPDVPL